MKNNSWRYSIYVDISGVLKSKDDDVYVGCILLNDKFRSAFRERFYREFPSLRSFNKKGTHLDPERLKRIIKFIHDTGVKMSVVVVERYMIKQIEKRVKEMIKEKKRINGEVSIKAFHEKLLGLAYFHALSKNTRTNYEYNSYSCMESQLDIQESFVALKRISFKKDYNFRMACCPRRTEHMIKFADFIASAGRKVDKFILNTFPNYSYIKFKPNDEELDIIFCISRRASTKRKDI